MSRLILASSLLCVASAGQSIAESYYVSADGKHEHDGSRERPWPSVAVALAKVGSGNTIVDRPGLYRGPISIGKSYAGSSDRPTVIQSEVKWKAVVIGAEVHGITTADDCDYVTVDGFEVLGARYDGIKMNGAYNVVRNCWVHNNGAMGIAMHDKKGGIIEANLIEFNGCHPQFHHGVYASGTQLTVRRNIVRHNATYGLHLYPAVQDSVIAQNVIHGHAAKGGILLACPEGGGRNSIVHNTVADNAEGIEIWGGNHEVVANNVLLAKGEVLSLQHGTDNVSADHNLWLLESSRRGEHDVVADPRFVDASRGVFWLTAASPARGKGDPKHAPDTDFWGRPVERNKPPDLGALPFVPALTSEAARASWRHGWPYRFVPQEKLDLPDLWSLYVPMPE